MTTGETGRMELAERVRSLASAFQGSRVLLTAIELDLFTVLEDEERTSAEVAAAIETDPRATDRLLNALVAIDLVVKRGERFANTPDGRRLLVRGRPEFMANLAHTNNLWDTWSWLTEVVRTGAPSGQEPVRARGDDWLRAFIGAMHWRGGEAARAVLPLVDLGGVSRLLDVGGGSGVFAMSFLTAAPGATGVVFDLPAVVPLTTAYIRSAGFESRVEVVGGDYTTGALPSGFDLVLLSAIVHSNSPAANARLVASCARALNPGGRLVIVDWLMEPSRTRPAMGALFAINMLVGTDGGDTYTEDEVRAWMTAAGFTGITRGDTRLGTGVLTGILR